MERISASSKKTVSWVPFYLGLKNWHHWLASAAVFLWCAIFGWWWGGVLGTVRVYWLLVLMGLRWVSFNGCGPSCGLVPQGWGPLLPRGWRVRFWGSVGGWPGTRMECLSVAGGDRASGPCVLSCQYLMCCCCIYYLVLLLSLFSLPLFPSLSPYPHPSLFLSFTSCPPYLVLCNLVCSQT